MGNGKPIFYDEERRRWRRTRRVMEIAGALFAFVLSFSSSIFFAIPISAPRCFPTAIRFATPFARPSPQKSRPFATAATSASQASASSPIIMTRCAPHSTRMAIPADSPHCKPTTKNSTCSFPKASWPSRPMARLDVDLDPKIGNWMRATRRRAAHHAAARKIPTAPSGTSMKWPRLLAQSRRAPQTDRRARAVRSHPAFHRRRPRLRASAGQEPGRFPQICPGTRRRVCTRRI